MHELDCRGDTLNEQAPRVYLAIDNCFGSKRWTRPREWAAIVRDLGLAYVEASADNECDPLYSTPEYMADWRAEVRAAQESSACGWRTSIPVTARTAPSDWRTRIPRARPFAGSMAQTHGRPCCRVGRGVGLLHSCRFRRPCSRTLAPTSQAQEDLYDRLATLARYACDRGASQPQPGADVHATPNTLDDIGRDAIDARRATHAYRPHSTLPWIRGMGAFNGGSCALIAVP